MTRALVVLLACSCAEPLPLRVRTLSSSKPVKVLPEVVTDACEILGVACEPSRRAYGSVTIDLIPIDDGRVRGREQSDLCRRLIWVDPTPLRVAHELGHALELDHVDDRSNLMHINAKDTELDDEQLNRIELIGGLIVGCR
jgi:hypothetical protein